MSELPDFRPGQRWSDVSAREMRHLVSAVRRTGNISGIGAKYTESGIALNGDEEFGERRPARPTFLLTQRYDSQTGQPMQIRKVRYAEVPVKEGEYDWADDPLDAYPDFGARYADYDEFLWTEALPSVDATFLRAERRDGLWFVERPVIPAATDYMVLLEVTGDESPWVRVAPIRKHTGTEWDGSFFIKTNAAVVGHLVPGFYGRHVRRFVFAPADNEFTSYGTALAVTKWQGLNIVEPLYRFLAAVRPSAEVSDVTAVA